MIGVRRPGVTIALSLLEKAGLTVTGGEEVPASFSYAGHEQAWTAHVSAGPLQKVIEADDGAQAIVAAVTTLRRTTGARIIVDGGRHLG